MNTNQRRNIINDIPGLDASKGERIIKALQRLWAKIERLEQLRISERKSRSEEIQSSNVEDVQYKLLVLQLQYVRSLLKKRWNSDDFIPSENSIGDCKLFLKRDKNYLNPKETKREKCHDVVSQETQTQDSLIKGMETVKKEHSPKQENEVETQANIGANHFNFENYSTNSKFASTKGLQPKLKINSQPSHYHLKLDDVPFLLGASSGVSHSVVANVQNIIAMMKSHNKALCGPKHIQRPLSSASPIATVQEDSSDVTKMLSVLTHELQELAKKQKNLEMRFKNAETEDKSKANPSKDAEKRSISSESACCRTVSDPPIKIHAQINSSKPKDSTKCSINRKQSSSNSRNQACNLPIVARQKLLRSLQNFKRHLSEEDISWE